MTEQSDQPAKRGDAAYRAQKDAIAARNDAARRAGKEHRQEEDRKAIARRQAIERAGDAELRTTFGGNTAH